jgi:hypothetical protein
MDLYPAKCLPVRVELRGDRDGGTGTAGPGRRDRDGGTIGAATGLQPGTSVSPASCSWESTPLHRDAVRLAILHLQ